MNRDRDTTNGSGEGAIRLRLLDGGLSVPPLLDGGWRVGPGVGAGGVGAGEAPAGARGDGSPRGRSTGREIWGAEPPAECVVVRSAVRAGDRHEPWTLPATDALRALADAAHAAGVDTELATRLALECALVCDDLRAAGVDLSALDAAAAAERIDGRLDAAAASYLRRLTGRRREPRPAPPVRCADPGAARRSAGFAPAGESAAQQPAGVAPAGAAARRPAGFAPAGETGAARRPEPLGEVVTVGLPVRLSARLLSADLDALASSVPLDRALAWETAAVVAGRTMSEWAPLTALRLGG